MSNLVITWTQILLFFRWASQPCDTNGFYLKFKTKLKNGHTSHIAFCSFVFFSHQLSWTSLCNSIAKIPFNRTPPPMFSSSSTTLIHSNYPKKTPWLHLPQTLTRCRNSKFAGFRSWHRSSGYYKLQKLL